MDKHNFRASCCSRPAPRANRRRLPLLSLLLLLFVLGIGGASAQQPLTAARISLGASAQRPDSVLVTLGFVGDIMAHQTQLTAQRQVDGSYDFTNNFAAMAPLFRSNDLMVANLETTFAGEQAGYSAYPLFNTPDALATAMQGAGINIAATANNHMFDKGGPALLRTVEVLRAANMAVIGSRADSQEARYLIKDVQGVRIGLTAFTYESGGFDGFRYINGQRVPRAYEPFLNSFDPRFLDEAFNRIEAVLAAMRVEGVDWIVFVVHWGEEYQLQPNAYQREMANRLHALGVHAVIGHHPHVVQPIDVMQDTLTGHTTFVAYSLGNFISNQRYESLQNYHTEDGLYVQLRLVKYANDSLVFRAVHYEPTWVHRYKAEERYWFEVLPAAEVLRDSSTHSRYDAAVLQRISASYTRTRSKVETPFDPARQGLMDRYLRRLPGIDSSEILSTPTR